MYANDLDPYDEAQHIREVWIRDNPVKQFHSNGFTQIEQKTREGANIVVEELRRMGFIVKNLQELPTGGYVCTIQPASRNVEKKSNKGEIGDR